jgi:anti-anti-sigma regulatory factor
MENFESKLHNPGVIIYRAKGSLTTDNVEEWREELSKFIKENSQRGACGVLIDVCDLESISPEALDALMELLGDPEETIRNVRMRFALIGVKPFTQRFLRETMPIEEIRHIRARFFHEVAEEEALAWLQAMVSTAEEEAKKAAPNKEEPKEAAAKTKEKEAPKAQKKEPEKKEKPKPAKASKEKKGAAAKLLPTLLKGTSTSEVAEKKEKLKQKIRAGR